MNTEKGYNCTLIHYSLHTFCLHDGLARIVIIVSLEYYCNAMNVFTYISRRKKMFSRNTRKWKNPQEFSLTLYSQKFRESNGFTGFTKEITK